MTLLALDQSSHITGWSVFQDGKLEYYGKFDCNDENIGKRLIDITNNVLNLIKQYDVDEVVVEDIQLQNNVGNNVQTFKILAEVYGALELVLTENNIPYSSILATSWKSKLGIKGKNRQEQKKNAQLYVQNTFDIKVIQDIADSVCIGLAHLSKEEKGFDWS